MTDPRLPEILHPALAQARERVEALLSALDDPRLDQEVARSLPRVWVASEFVARQCERDPELVRDIVGSGELMLSYVPGLLAARLRAAVEGAGDDAALMRALRRARNRELCRIAWRDLAGWATLEETLADRSDLAEAAIGAALARVGGWHAERFGAVRDAAGRPLELMVLGMGKLGAHELNFSSDVDLIFAAAEGRDSDGPRPLVAEEYFLRLGQRLIRVLDEVTPDGFVERVDMRLRPFGESGPLVMGAAAIETYYQVHGREWERYALIKARALAGDLSGGERLLKSLRPFVYRRYLDYGVFDSLRDMKGRIEGEVARRGMEHDIKLGRGGIREVEFIGQCFQLVRGGRDRRFQERGIVKVLTLLGEGGFIPKERAGGLLEAYRFLRRVENRLQQWSDQQVHVLPDSAPAQARLAWSMGHADWDGFARELDGHRGRVQRAFEETVVGPRAGHRAAAKAAGLERVLAEDAADPALRARIAALGYDDPAAALAQLARLRDGPVARSASEQGRRRLAELSPALLAAAAQGARPLVTLERLVGVVESLARRTTYLALLNEMPAALVQLTRLVGASGWIAELVARQPVLLDELIDPRLFAEPPRLDGYAGELAEALARVETVDGAPDEEGELDALREFKQAATLRVAAADIGGALPLMKVSDHLTGIAECAVRAVLEMAWRSAVARHGEPRRPDGSLAPFAVVAYGKLGGWELGYGSDLDLVFLHDAATATTDGARAVDGPAFCLRLGQRIIHLLTTPTASGILYEVDTRLRPEGMKGSLVTSLEAFERYQREEAWTWEHQALLRARAVAGDAALMQRFAAVRRAVLARPRDAAKLKADVVAMRERMRREIPRVAAADGDAAGRGFDLKGDPGGITDLEFLVQHRVLANAAAHPALLDWPDVIRFLEGLAREALLPEATCAALADAYRALRGRVHACSLQGEPALAGADELAAERALVQRLWAEEFGA